MNIAVIGLGSMGKRRIRLIRQHFDPTISIVGVDSNVERKESCIDNWGIIGADTIEDAFRNHEIQIAFVCTSPLSHADLIEFCLTQGAHVFSEINLTAAKYEENMELAEEKGVVLYLSSTPLYRKEMQYISRKVQEYQRRVNYVYHVGQYLPDWHPWEHYKDYFISDHRTSGCREIFAIDLPWMIQAFGQIKNISVMSDRMTELNIDYPDNFMVSFEHETGSKGVFIVDLVMRKAVRSLTVYGEELQIEWNGQPDSLAEYNLETKEMEVISTYEKAEHADGYADFIIEDGYIDEIRTFFEQIKGTASAPYGFKDDLYTLSVIDRIERGGQE